MAQLKLSENKYFDKAKERPAKYYQIKKNWKKYFRLLKTGWEKCTLKTPS